MGLCCSVSAGNETTASSLRGDESSLMTGHQNGITEAMLKANLITPPAPLLKEINFAVVDDNAEDVSDSSIDEQDIDDLLNEEEDGN